jgi:hypothetical protein
MRHLMVYLFLYFYLRMVNTKITRGIIMCRDCGKYWFWSNFKYCSGETVENSGFGPISSIVLGYFPGETVESSGFGPISSIVLGHFPVQAVESNGFCPISSIVLGHFPVQTGK